MPTGRQLQEIHSRAAGGPLFFLTTRPSPDTMMEEVFMAESTPKKILVVDDESAVRDIYNREFTKAGFKVFLAADGQEGLLKAGEEIPDLILLDVMMPKMSGIDTIKALKKNDLTKKIPVLLLTNLGEEQIIKEGFKYGIDGYLLKVSYTPSQVVEECRKFLGDEKQD